MTPFTAAEIAQFRADTPGTAERIHLNNAGSSLPPDPVLHTVIQYLQEEARLGGYEMADKYKKELEQVYVTIGQLINAHPEEIALTENASIAWDMAFNGIDFMPGDEIITSEYEYVTNLLGFLKAKKANSISIKVIPQDANGQFSLEGLEATISSRTKLIAITHIASSAGGVLPVEAIGKIANKHQILYLVDACQSVGHLPIDVKAIGCDMLSVTGRKYLRAPRGTGFLYVRREVIQTLSPVFMDGVTTSWITEQDYQLQTTARRFELFEKNKALLLGLGKAAEYALQAGLDRIWQRIQYLSGMLRTQLLAIPGVTVHAQGDIQCGIVVFSVNNMECSKVREQMAAQHINISVSPTAATLYYMNKHGLNTVARASVHYYNTEEEINTFVQALEQAVKVSQ